MNAPEMPEHSACRNGCMGMLFINDIWQCPWQRSNTYTTDVKPEQYHLFSPRERMLHISNAVIKETLEGYEDNENTR